MMKASYLFNQYDDDPTISITTLERMPFDHYRFPVRIRISWSSALEINPRNVRPLECSQAEALIGVILALEHLYLRFSHTSTSPIESNPIDGLTQFGKDTFSRSVQRRASSNASLWTVAAEVDDISPATYWPTRDSILKRLSPHHRLMSTDRCPISSSFIFDSRILEVAGSSSKQCSFVTKPPTGVEIHLSLILVVNSEEKVHSMELGS